MTNRKFDEELVKEIRLYYGWLIIKGESDEIVPKELTHNYLLSNFKISENIREYYYLPCRDMLSKTDYENMVSHGYVGDSNTTLTPYPFCYKGSYIQRKKLFFQIMHLMHKTEKYKNKPIEKFVDLFPYFDVYSQGFKKGFESFEDDCIAKFFPMFADKSDYVNKVFEYVTKEIIFRHSWRNNHSGFTISMSVSDKIKNSGEIVDAFEDGKFQGYFYKAWSLILSNSNLYEQLFNDYLNPKVESSDYNIATDLLKAAHTLQQNKIFWTADEDTRTRQLLDLLPEKYQTKDQSKYGKSSKGIKAGSVDGVIKINGIEIFVEAFNLNNLTKSIIKSHLNKLENNYDSKGLKEKFVVVYYNLRTNTFKKAFEKYKDYIENEHKFIYPRVKEAEEITTKYTDSRMFKTFHDREGKEVILYHLVLMFPK